MTPAQRETLGWVAWTPDEVWWHDLPHPTREVLWAMGWIRHARRVKCCTHGHTHPGYVTISKLGLAALAAPRGTK